MNSTITLLFSTLLALVLGVAILIYFDEGTLFLATLLLSVIAIKIINAKMQKDSDFSTSTLFISKFSGLWFALSIAPAFGVSQMDIFLFENGFFIQTILSLGFFIFFYRSKLSMIGRIQRNVKGGVGVIASSILAGAAAGISSSSLWQGYIYISSLL